MTAMEKGMRELRNRELAGATSRENSMVDKPHHNDENGHREPSRHISFFTYGD